MIFYDVNLSFTGVEFKQVVHPAFPIVKDIVKLLLRVLSFMFSHAYVTCYRKDIGMTICHGIWKIQLCLAWWKVGVLKVNQWMRQTMRYLHSILNKNKRQQFLKCGNHTLKETHETFGMGFVYSNRNGITKEFQARQ